MVNNGSFLNIPENKLQEYSISANVFILHLYIGSKKGQLNHFHLLLIFIVCTFMKYANTSFSFSYTYIYIR